MLRAGTAAGKQSCGWGLRHSGAFPAQLAQEGPSRLARDAAPDPQLGHLPDIYRINTRGDEPDEHNFFPLPPLRPVVLFLVTSFSWQQNGGGG